ncbi:MAG: hypothetical protein V1872_00015 [bacterium]
MKNKLAFLFRFLIFFLILGAFWWGIYKFYVYVLIKIIAKLSFLSSLKNIWIRDAIVYFTFKGTIVKPIPQMPFSDILILTINIVTLLSLLLASPSMGYKLRFKKVLLAVSITFIVHVLSLYLSILSVIWKPFYATNIFQVALSEWTKVAAIKIGFLINVFWSQIGNKVYPVAMWLILAQNYIFKKKLF